MTFTLVIINHLIISYNFTIYKTYHQIHHLLLAQVLPSERKSIPNA